MAGNSPEQMYADILNDPAVAGALQTSADRIEQTTAGAINAVESVVAEQQTLVSHERRGGAGVEPVVNVRVAELRQKRQTDLDNIRQQFIELYHDFLGQEDARVLRENRTRGTRKSKPSQRDLLAQGVGTLYGEFSVESTPELLQQAVEGRGPIGASEFRERLQILQELRQRLEAQISAVQAADAGQFEIAERIIEGSDTRMGFSREAYQEEYVLGDTWEQRSTQKAKGATAKLKEIKAKGARRYVLEIHVPGNRKRDELEFNQTELRVYLEQNGYAKVSGEAEEQTRFQSILSRIPVGASFVLRHPDGNTEHHFRRDEDGLYTRNNAPADDKVTRLLELGWKIQIAKGVATEVDSTSRVEPVAVASASSTKTVSPIARSVDGTRPAAESNNGRASDTSEPVLRQWMHKDTAWPVRFRMIHDQQDAWARLAEKIQRFPEGIRALDTAFEELPEKDQETATKTGWDKTRKILEEVEALYEEQKRADDWQGDDENHYYNLLRVRVGAYERILAVAERVLNTLRQQSGRVAPTRNEAVVPDQNEAETRKVLSEKEVAELGRRIHASMVELLENWHAKLKVKGVGKKAERLAVITKYYPDQVVKVLQRVEQDMQVQLDLNQRQAIENFLMKLKDTVG